MTANALVWLRNDLRLADNPALQAAVKLGGKITALYVHETNPHLRAPGGAVLWWLEQSLGSLEKASMNAMSNCLWHAAKHSILSRS